MPHVPGERHAGGVEAGRHLGHRHRPVEVVAHVLLARPQHLDRLLDLPWRSAPPATRNPASRRAGRSRRRAWSCARSRCCGGTPAAWAAAASAASPFCVGAQISTLSPVTWAVQFCGSMRGVAEERHVVFGLDALGRLREAGRDVAVLAPDAGVVGRSPPRRKSLDAGARDLPVAAVVPGDGRARRRAFFACHQLSATTATASSQLHDLADALDAGDFGARRPTSACR